MKGWSGSVGILPLGLRGLLAGLLVLCAAACGGDGKEEEPPYVRIVSEGFVFDENDPEANRVEVISNTQWRVTATPADAAVVFEPASGAGDGSFRIADMPQGKAIRVNVQPLSNASRGESIVVTRAPKEPDAPDPGPAPGPEPDPVGGYRFPELPSNWTEPTGSKATIKGDYAFFTHWSQSVESKKRVRNYSYCYDTRRHNPVWVAYPLHPVYREGGTGRTDPDPWAPDPALDEKYQSKIYKSANEGGGSYEGFQFWGTALLESMGKEGYWSKGHLCMSSERGGKDAPINIQTFYPTNIAPQSSNKASDFATVWSYVESLF